VTKNSGLMVLWENLAGTGTWNNFHSACSVYLMSPSPSPLFHQHSQSGLHFTRVCQALDTYPRGQSLWTFARRVRELPFQIDYVMPIPAIVEDESRSFYCQ